MSIFFGGSNKGWFGGYGYIWSYSPNGVWKLEEELPSSIGVWALAVTNDGNLIAGIDSDGKIGDFGAFIDQYGGWTKIWNDKGICSGVGGLLADTQGSIGIGEGIPAQSGGCVDGIHVKIGAPSFFVNDNPLWINNDEYQSGYQIDSLVPRGSYFVSVSKAVGSDGIEIAPDIVFTFTVDYPPETSITSKPANFSNSSSASFQFSGEDEGSSGIAFFECQLDGDGWATCASPKSYNGLSDGSHTFEARAVDNHGAPDASPASYTWIVDTIAPQTSLTIFPSNPISSTSASFEFTGDDTSGSGIDHFECHLDSGDWFDCASPKSYSALSEGLHTFQVRAVDKAQNPDLSPESRTWRVDTIAPQTSITASPPDPSYSTEASFQFDGQDAGGSGVAYYECQIDGGNWLICASPISYSDWNETTHTFKVRAVDNAGNADSSPASFLWTIKPLFANYLPQIRR